MARPTGVRFSDREETQRGSRNSRAVTTGNLTNKNDRLPALQSDFVRSTSRDVSEALKDENALDRKGNPSRGAAQANKVASISRAQSRLGGTAGYLAGAYGAGELIGRGIGAAGGDELVRKGIDKSGLGSKIDEASAPSKDRVKLTEEAKKRIESGELDKGRDERVNKEDYPTYKKETKSADSFREEFKAAKKEGKDSFSFEGRKYNTDEKPALAKGGYVNCGASVAPAQKAKK